MKALQGSRDCSAIYNRSATTDWFCSPGVGRVAHVASEKILSVLENKEIEQIIARSFCDLNRTNES